MNVAAICYSLIGFGGIILNIFVAITIILKHKGSSDNATFKFMFHLALSDIESICGNILGPSLMGQEILPKTDTMRRIISYLNACGFRGSNYWMVLIAFSRWLCFANKGWLTKLSSGRVQHALGGAIWIGLHVFYTPFFFYPDSIYPTPALYLYTNSTYSQFLQYWDRGHDVASAILQIIFQVAAIAWIYQMRNQVLVPELRKYRKQEIRLFIQCALDSSLYCLVIIMLNIVVFTDHEYLAPWFTTATTVLFYFNHIDCAIFYILFSQEIRKFIGGLHRFCGSGPTQNDGNKKIDGNNDRVVELDNVRQAWHS